MADDAGDTPGEDPAVTSVPPAQTMAAAALGAALLQGEVSGPADAERASPRGAVAPAGLLPVSPEAQGLPQRHGAALRTAAL